MSAGATKLPGFDRDLNATNVVLKNKSSVMPEKFFDEIAATATDYINLSGFNACDLEIMITGGWSLVFYMSIDRIQAPADADYNVDVTADLFGVAAVTSSAVLKDDSGALSNCYLKVVATRTSGTLSLWTGKRN